MENNRRIIRILIVDDNPITRVILRGIFESSPDFELIAEAFNDRDVIHTAIGSVRPDLMILKISRPENIATISDIMKTQPIPILAITDNPHYANDALAHGAVKVVKKSDLNEITWFLEKIRSLSSIHVLPPLHSLSNSIFFPHVFAIASSTGGPQALARILGNLSPDFSCPILVAQHVAPGFSQGMADWLDSVSGLPVKLAHQHDEIMSGVVYLSPSESHTRLTSSYHISFSEIQKTDIYRPSCNILLESVASVCRDRSIGLILTGMGNDGVTGIAEIAAAGGITIAQDQSSSVVFGMNRDAIDKGYISKILHIDRIADEMIRLSHEEIVL